MARARHERVEVGAVVGPGAGHELAAPGGVGLVPGVDVAVDEGVEVVGHGGKVAARGGRVDYLAR